MEIITMCIIGEYMKIPHLSADKWGIYDKGALYA